MSALPPPALAGLLAQSREWLVVTDAEGRIRWCNPAFVEATGWSEDGADKPSIPTCLAPDNGVDPSEFQGLLAEALRGGHLADTVVRFQAPGTRRVADDDALWARLRIGPCGDLRLWTFGDIRAERAEQARLQRLKELLDTAQEFGRMGVWERDIVTGRGHWDEYIFRYWGLDPSKGTPSFDDAMARVHPEDRQNNAFAESTRRVGRYAQRYRVFGPQGDVRWIHSQWEIKADANGVPTRAVGVMVDDTEVVATARSLDDASAQLALAVELGQITVWRHDLRSNRMAYNRRGFEVLGIPYRPEGLSIEEVRSHIHPDDLPGVLAAGQHALRNAGPTDMEARYRRSDGTWRHVLTRRVVQRDTTGTPVAFIGVALDVTESVEQQRRTEELQHRFDSAATAAGIGIWSRDPATEEAHWNEQMYRLCGRAPELGPPSNEEWLGHMVHPDDRVAMRQARPQAMQAIDGTVEHEYRLMLPEGRVRWLSNRTRREVWNGRTLLFGATIDITERRLAEQALRQANERVALATRGAGIATWEHDLASGEVRWDAQMYALRGLTMPSELGEIRLAPLALRESLAHPDELPLLHEANRRSLEDGAMASYEFRVRWPDGSYRWLASRSVPVRGEDGHVVRQIGVNWDIHERVNAEAARQEALASQRQNEARSQFLARMSHELRTPLNAILGFTQLLELEAEPSAIDDAHAGAPVRREGYLFKLRHIRQASEQLLTLVNEVLDLTSIEAGELQLKLEPVALDRLVLDALQQVQAAAQARGVKLLTEASDQTVLADPGRVRQVLVKLLALRIRLVAPGGTVQIRTASDGADVVLDIGDHGRVLTPAQQLSLFEPFGRVVPGETPDGGVNLALVKALMACMRGRIDLESTDEHGTRFLLRLPKAPLDSGVAPTLARVALDTTAPAAPVPSRPTGTVLYIEDNLVNVILVQELIAQRGGLELVCETTAAAGVARARAMRPDLVLIDMQLPDFDGFEVLRRLRADPLTMAANCIALSANAMPDDVARALAAGFDDYWTKPIRFNSFLAGLDGLFPPT